MSLFLHILLIFCLIFHETASFRPRTLSPASKRTSLNLRTLGALHSGKSFRQQPFSIKTHQLTQTKRSENVIIHSINLNSHDKITSGTGLHAAKKYAASEVLNSFNQLSGRPSNRRGKMGAPKRKQQQFRNKEEQNDDMIEGNIVKSQSRPGRVSVYCVGSGIDIPALRAHVFRRGFGNNSQQQEQPGQNNGQKLGSIPASSNLRLTRRAEDSIFDDEVLHVSNAPMFVSANNRLASWDDEEFLHEASEEQSEDNEKESNHPQTTSLKNKEMLLMATQDIFYFEYGCVVFWGLTSHEEKAALQELSPFISEPVTPVELEDSFDTMEYVFDQHGGANNNPNNPHHRPIKFDRIKIRSLRLEEKLAYSYAMAQSSKLFVFESKVLESVERTRYLPKDLATKGKITCSKRELNSLIGQLFVEQTEVNLFSSILDTPDSLWDDDGYLPTYQFARSYLEVDHRVSLLNSRLSVIRELLDVLTAQVADSNSTRLEWIAIWLIAIEIALSIATSPLFVGTRVMASLAVPVAIFLYRQMTNSERQSQSIVCAQIVNEANAEILNAFAVIP